MLLTTLDLLNSARLPAYSDSSGCRLAPGPPPSFFSQYFLTQASQLFPAAGSRPLKASAAISEYAIFIRPLPLFGKILTNESLASFRLPGRKYILQSCPRFSASASRHRGNQTLSRAPRALPSRSPDRAPTLRCLRVSGREQLQAC